MSEKEFVEAYVLARVSGVAGNFNINVPFIVNTGRKLYREIHLKCSDAK